MDIDQRLRELFEMFQSSDPFVSPKETGLPSLSRVKNKPRAIIDYLAKVRKMEQDHFRLPGLSPEEAEVRTLRELRKLQRPGDERRVTRNRFLASNSPLKNGKGSYKSHKRKSKLDKAIKRMGKNPMGLLLAIGLSTLMGE